MVIHSTCRDGLIFDPDFDRKHDQVLVIQGVDEQDAVLLDAGHAEPPPEERPSFAGLLDVTWASLLFPRRPRTSPPGPQAPRTSQDRRR